MLFDDAYLPDQAAARATGAGHLGLEVLAAGLRHGKTPMAIPKERSSAPSLLRAVQLRVVWARVVWARVHA